jgi:transcriptional regulator with XRE-family HTH domain
VVTFGEKLKIARKKKNLSQDMLAKLVGVSRVAITNFEGNKNTPTYSNLKKLSLILEEEFAEVKNELPMSPVPIMANTSCGATQVSSFQLENEFSYIREDKWNKDLYCVIANGESMFPLIHDQAEVIINPLIEPVNGNLVLYRLDDESAIKVLVVEEEAYMMQFVPINPREDFKTKTIRLDDEDTLERLTIHKVHRVINPDANNKEAILKMIGR